MYIDIFSASTPVISLSIVGHDSAVKSQMNGYYGLHMRSNWPASDQIDAESASKFEG